MEFAKIDSEYYCGIDLDSCSMHVNVMDKSGNIHFRRNMINDFTIFKESMTILYEIHKIDLKYVFGAGD